MDEINTSFKEYIESFKQMSIPDKRLEIIHSINEITVMFDALAKNSNIELSYLKSNEVLDLKQGNESEDDYLEALLVYIENAKSMIGEYLIKKNEI
ncbi:MAG: hypothetical protein E7163_01925 [Firmicutes bacterium]|nr:hypothetical protein [Bacillota bacterium]